MIEIKNLTVQYIKDFYSLYNVNLNISKNTILLGDQLSGGFALLRAIAKLDNHYTGEILINGKNIKQQNIKNLNIAYLPNEPVLFKLKTVKQNIIYPLVLRKIDKKTCTEKVENLVEKFGIEFDYKKAKNLNKSEAKIVAVLRAFIREPDIVLVEHFYDDLDPNYQDLANKIFEYFSSKTLIIACEENLSKCFENFEKHTLLNGSLID